MKDVNKDFKQSLWLLQYEFLLTSIWFIFVTVSKFQQNTMKNCIELGARISSNFLPRHFSSRLAKFCTFGRVFVHFDLLFYYFSLSYYLSTMSIKLVLSISVITQVLSSLHKPSIVNSHHTWRRLVWLTEKLSSKLKILPFTGLCFMSSRKKEVWVGRWTNPPPKNLLLSPPPPTNSSSLLFCTGVQFCRLPF